jgi:hypothetical protein
MPPLILTEDYLINKNFDQISNQKKMVVKNRFIRNNE